MSEFLLAIDTSTRTASVALARDGAPVAEYTWQAGQNHTQQLLPVVKAVLLENGAKLADVAVFALTTGPGSFNGLRVGMATAKAFARTFDRPLVAASSLEVEAWPHAAFPGPICAVHDAGRKELAWAVYRSSAKGWCCTSEPQITAAEDLAAGEGALFCGEVPEWALSHLPEGALFAGRAASVRRASALAELAWERYVAGERAHIERLQPLYLRRAPGGGET